MNDNPNPFTDLFDNKEPDEAEESIDTCYASVRGVRPMVYMLELRNQAGNSTAFDYGWLRKALFNRSQGITLHFEETSILIEGQRLQTLFDAIVRHRVTWIQERDAVLASATPGTDRPLVTKISIVEP
jgi:hypothetical protein